MLELKKNYNFINKNWLLHYKYKLLFFHIGNCIMVENMILLLNLYAIFIFNTIFNQYLIYLYNKLLVRN